MNWEIGWNEFCNSSQWIYKLIGMNLENDSKKTDFSHFHKLLKKADPVKGLWRARNRTRGQNDTFVHPSWDRRSKGP